MKRDCGSGKLKPIAWEVVSSVGKSDDELEFRFTTQAEAEVKLAQLVSELTPFSNVRLYAVDKQKYANCIVSVFCNPQGVIETRTNRRGEL